MGGGTTSINATIISASEIIELSAICNKDQECDISDPKYQNKDFTNTTPFSLKTINIQTQINTLTNASNLTSTDSLTIKIENNGKNGKLNHLINTGNISGGIYINNENALTQITNKGEMRGVWAHKTQNITINNYGTIKTAVGNYMSNQSSTPAHFMFENGESTLTIENYAIKIIENTSEFNNFSGYNSRTDNKNSHLIVWEHGNIKKFVAFKDEKSKIILDFGGDFELGKEYLISKLITNQNGTKLENLTIDFSRLTLKEPDIYSLTNSGEYFIVKLLDKIKEGIVKTQITEIYKSNIRTMNNFYTISNALIYPRKSYHSQNLGSSSLRASEYERGNPPIKESLDSTLDSALDSANPLKSYESFAYRSESVNRRIQRQNKRNYSRQPRNLSQNQRTSQNQPHNLNNYYFILTPFVNYNSFAQSGNYNLSGFDYGFLTAFSGKLTQNNSLGAHFMMSYGNLGDSKDKDFNITNLNLNVGVNYKLDLIWDMFIKARGDFFYFLNQVSSASVAKTNADNIGFGLSVSYGKDFDFKQGGVLGIEVGIDYKALRTNDISVKSALDNANMQDYQKSLVNLIYTDLGANYAKYFGGFGINVGLGFRANLAPKLAKTQLIIANNTLNVLIDNDKFLGYANAGISYMINHKNFDMEFSIVYYGSFGDRGISNGGGMEWRVNF